MFNIDFSVMQFNVINMIDYTKQKKRPNWVAF